MATQHNDNNINNFYLPTETAIQRHKANDLQTLMALINNYQNQQPSASDIQIMNIIEDYFIDSQQELNQEIEDYTISKLSLIESTNQEMDRMRYLIQELNKYIIRCSNSISSNVNSRNNRNDTRELLSADHSAPDSPKSRTKSLTFSPLKLPSPEIDIKPLDLEDIPSKFKQNKTRPRRYSTVPESWNGKYRIETVKKGTINIQNLSLSIFT